MTAGERTPDLKIRRVCSPWGSLGIEKPHRARPGDGTRLMGGYEDAAPAPAVPGVGGPDS